MIPIVEDLLSRGRGGKAAVGKLLLLSGLSLMFTPATAQEKPPPRFESWGVCPFECCTYRDWTADEPMPVHAGRNDSSPVLFRLRQGEHVDALTGVVVAVKPAVVTLDKPLPGGLVQGRKGAGIELKAGDTVYLLSPLGEGAYRFWYQGKAYNSGVEMATMPGVDSRNAELVWWKQVKNKAGKKGWTRSSKFSNVDACG